MFKVGPYEVAPKLGFKVSEETKEANDKAAKQAYQKRTVKSRKDYGVKSETTNEIKQFLSEKGIYIGNAKELGIEVANLSNKPDKAKYYQQSATKLALSGLVDREFRHGEYYWKLNNKKEEDHVRDSESSNISQAEQSIEPIQKTITISDQMITITKGESTINILL